MPPVPSQPLLLFAALCLAALALPAAAQQEDEPATTTTVAVQSTTPDDEIRSRLDSIFSSLDELSSINTSVTSGVVTLTGTVPTSEAISDAGELANRTEGVVLVRNRLQPPAEVAARLAPAIDKLRELYHASIRKLPLLGIALLVIVLAVVIGNFIYRRQSLFRRFGLSSLANNLARRLSRLALIILGIVAALEILDATAIVGAVLGVAGLAGIAVGFAFRNIAENYLAGILLSTRNPFELGDTVEIAGQQGKVARLTSRDTVLVTLDGNHLRIPNATVVNSELTNLSRNPLRRFDFTVGVSVDLELGHARTLAVETLTRAPGVLADPAPSAIIEELGDSAVVIRLLAWIDQRDSDFLKTRSESIRLVKTAFDDAGIEMPEPIYRLHVRNFNTPSAGTADSGPPPQPTTATTRLEPSPVDIAPDPSIDAEVERESNASDAPNLLDPQPEPAKV